MNRIAVKRFTQRIARKARPVQRHPLSTREIIQASRLTQSQNAMREMNELLSHSLKKREVVEKTSIDASAIFEYARNSGIDLEVGQEYSVDFDDDDDDEFEDDLNEDEYNLDGNQFDDYINQHRVFYYVNPDHPEGGEVEEEDWESEEGENEEQVADGQDEGENSLEEHSQKIDNSQSNSSHNENSVQNEFAEFHSSNDDAENNEGHENTDSANSQYQPQDYSEDQFDGYISEPLSEYEISFNQYQIPPHEFSESESHYHDDYDDQISEHSYDYQNPFEWNADPSEEMHLIENEAENSKEWRTIHENSYDCEDVGEEVQMEEDNQNSPLDEDSGIDEEAEMFYDWVEDDDHNSELFYEFIEDEGSIEYEEVVYPYHSNYRTLNRLRGSSSRHKESESSVSVVSSQCHISDSFDSDKEITSDNQNNKDECRESNNHQQRRASDSADDKPPTNSHLHQRKYSRDDSQRDKPNE
jgi:hypothetical protein